MSAALLYESPFTDLAPRGPDGLFPSSRVDGLVPILDRVRVAAVAAWEPSFGGHFRDGRGLLFRNASALSDLPQAL